MKKIISLHKQTFLFVLLTLLLVGSSARAQTASSTLVIAPEVAPDLRSELIVNKEGSASVNGLRVLQRAGSTIFGRLYWGESYLRLSVRTNSMTVIKSRFGETISLADVHEGDIIGARGELLSGSTELSLLASSTVDYSYQKNHHQFEGTITGFSTSTPGFLLATSERVLTVFVGTSTAVQKCTRHTVGETSLLSLGDKIVQLNGVYDRAGQTVEATDITSYFDNAILKPKNFKGVIQELPSGDALPQVLKAVIDDQTYTITIATSTKIMGKSKKPLALNRFVKGDHVALYGARKEAALTTIDAEIVRNLDL